VVPRLTQTNPRWRRPPSLILEKISITPDWITGSAVALHCCKAHAKINRKIENSTPCKIVTHEDFNLKLGARDYVGDTTHHATLGSNRPSGGFPSKVQKGKYNPDVTFLVILFFSRSRAQVERSRRFLR